MTIFEQYREAGYKANAVGCFEEWTLWLKENVYTMTIAEIKQLMSEMEMNNNLDGTLYEEHLELCRTAISLRAST